LGTAGTAKSATVFVLDNGGDEVLTEELDSSMEKELEKTIFVK
jgi:hypothetical protein